MRYTLKSKGNKPSLIKGTGAHVVALAPYAFHFLKHQRLSAVLYLCILREKQFPAYNKG